MRRITDVEKERIWDIQQAGVPVKSIARVVGRTTLRCVLHQYVLYRSDLSVYNQRQPDAIAKSLNTGPRKGLGFMAPSEAFAEAVATTA